MFIHTEHLKQYGANFDVSLSDFYFDTSGSLVIAHAGQRYGEIDLSRFLNGSSDVRVLTSDGQSSLLNLSALQMNTSSNATSFAQSLSPWVPPSTTSNPTNSSANSANPPPFTPADASFAQLYDSLQKGFASQVMPA